MDHVLALDVGSVRIGVAISDPFGTFAQGVGFLDAKSDWLDQLDRMIKERNVSTVVVGLPVRTSGKHDREAGKVVSMVDKLKRMFPDVSFVLWDERYTTVIAQRLLLESNMSGKKKGARST